MQNFDVGVALERCNLFCYPRGRVSLTESRELASPYLENGKRAHNHSEGRNTIFEDNSLSEAIVECPHSMKQKASISLAATRQSSTVLPTTLWLLTRTHGPLKPKTQRHISINGLELFQAPSTQAHPTQNDAQKTRINNTFFNRQTSLLVIGMQSRRFQP